MVSAVPAMNWATKGSTVYAFFKDLYSSFASRLRTLFMWDLELNAKFDEESR